MRYLRWDDLGDLKLASQTFQLVQRWSPSIRQGHGVHVGWTDFFYIIFMSVFIFCKGFAHNILMANIPVLIN